jgi:hypothetical protein
MDIYAFLLFRMFERNWLTWNDAFCELCFKMETTHNKHFSFVNISLLLLSFWFLKYCVLSFIDCNNEENKKMRCQKNITRAEIAIYLTVLLSKKQWKSTLDWSVYLHNLIMNKKNRFVITLCCQTIIFLTKVPETHL